MGPAAGQDSRPPTVATAASWLLLVAGALFVIGSLLPWMTASTPFGTIERGALDGDGILTLVAGVVLLACGGAGLARVARQPVFVVGLIAASVGAAVAAYDGARITQLLSSINAEEDSPVIGQVGVGLVLVALAVLPALAGLCAAGSRFVTPPVSEGRQARPRANAVLQALAVVVLVGVVGAAGASGANQPLELNADAAAAVEDRDEDFTTGSDDSDDSDFDFGSDADLDLGEDDPAVNAGTLPEVQVGADPAEAPAEDGGGAVTEEPAASEETELETQALPEPEPEPEPVTPVGPLTLEAQPGSGPSGSVISVTGSGWSPGSYITLTYSDPATGATQDVGEAEADARGRFTAEVLPSDEGEPGGRVITAAGDGQQMDAYYEMTG